MASTAALFVLDSNGECFIVEWDNDVIKVYTYANDLYKFTTDQIDQCDIIECNGITIDTTPKSYEIIKKIITTHLTTLSRELFSLRDFISPPIADRLKNNCSRKEESSKTPTNTDVIYVTTTYPGGSITVPLFDPTAPIGFYDNKTFTRLRVHQ